MIRITAALPSDISLGSDPEYFVIQNNKAVSAYQALGGDRDYQLPYGTLVPDGAAIEFTVTPTTSPVEIAERMLQNTKAALAIVRQQYPEAQLSNIPWINVNHLIKSHPKKLGNRCSLQVFGCNPDFSIYGTDLQRPNPAKFPYRSSGGHIHLGLHTVLEGMRYMEQETYVRKLVVLLDVFIGTATTFGSQLEEAKQRKELYGQAGVIRTTKLPVLEYRTPTSQFVTASTKLTELVFKVAQQCAIAALMLAEEDLYELALGASSTIDTHDIEGTKVWFQAGLALLSNLVDTESMRDLYTYLTTNPLQNTTPFAQELEAYHA